MVLESIRLPSTDTRFGAPHNILYGWITLKGTPLTSVFSRLYLSINCLRSMISALYKSRYIFIHSSTPLYSLFCCSHGLRPLRTTSLRYKSVSHHRHRSRRHNTLILLSGTCIYRSPYGGAISVSSSYGL